ncbi:MAG: DUF5678 domain-containing protein [Blastocatellia bacterium]
MTVSANVSSILHQIAALNADELAELRAQLENQAPNGSDDAVQPQLQPDPQDEAAFKWINEHGNEYPGQWLVLDGDRLLAHGPDLAEVAAAARAAGVRFPLLHLVEPTREYPYIRS